MSLGIMALGKMELGKSSCDHYTIVYNSLQQRNRRSRKTSGETEDEIVIIGDDSEQKLESGAPENPFDQLDSKKEKTKGLFVFFYCFCLIRFVLK